MTEVCISCGKRVYPECFSVVYQFEAGKRGLESN